LDRRVHFGVDRILDRENGHPGSDRPTFDTSWVHNVGRPVARRLRRR
jgi:hypothetical protein